ncbi:DUF4179 domain-containing protein [Paenibacillus alvei]|uniref:DUF4179 domain-containing protein n=1 Tax=Paenibacillus alvei TaxID=44250 RepID=UPI0018CE81C9|nr:DUF4179 domain-containing protein [Paenibacillus alvei]MBG9736761.1 hypothetical protein [Paenibacillus alvei]MBG9746917.1 hypothetical protein [Paenibacillus alvei]MCY9581940.1 DUF4179 domain-containing protein [Paenibacillus alvei]MCY9585838.1 DUF4179 domain-containing protein [Paenibacillus alvei]
MDSHVDKQIRERLAADHGSGIPKLVKSRLEQTLHSLETEPAPAAELLDIRNSMHSKRRRKAWYVAVSALLIISGILASGFISPVMAETLKKVPFIGQIFDSLGDDLLQHANRNGMSVPVNLSATDNGITLTITEILYDGAQIKLGFKEESQAELPVITPNYQRFEMPNLSSDDPTISWIYAMTKTRAKSPTEHFGILTFGSMNGEILEQSDKIPDNFTLSFTIKQVGDVNGVKGNWEFHVPIKLNNAPTKKISVMETKKTLDGRGYITLQSVIASPLGTEIRFLTQSSQTARKANSPDFTGLDISFLVIDENGNEIAWEGGRGRYSGTRPKNAEYEMLYQYAPLAEYVKSIRFLPVGRANRYGDVAIPLDLNALPCKLQQGDIGSVTVKSITFEQDKTIVHYDIKGDWPSAQSQRLVFIQGKQKHLTYNWNTKLLSKSNGIHSYVSEYDPMDKNQEIKLYTPKMTKPIFFKELEFQIPIR